MNLESNNWIRQQRCIINFIFPFLSVTVKYSNSEHFFNVGKMLMQKDIHIYSLFCEKEIYQYERSGILWKKIVQIFMYSQHCNFVSFTFLPFSSRTSSAMCSYWFYVCIFYMFSILSSVHFQYYPPFWCVQCSYFCNLRHSFYHLMFIFN